MRFKMQPFRCMIWTCLLLKESPAVLSLRKNVKNTVIRMHDNQVSHHISSIMGETSSVKPTTTLQPNTRPKASNDRKQTRVVGDHEPSAETELRDWLQPLTEGLTWGSSSSTDVFPPDVGIPPLAHLPSARPSEKPLSNKSGGNQHLFFSFFTKTRIAKSADARKVQERHAEEILTIGRTEFRLLRNVVIWLQQTTKFSIIDIASQICSGRARPGDAMDSKLSIQDQMSSRDVEKSQKNLKSRRKPKIH